MKDMKICQLAGAELPDIQRLTRGLQDLRAEGKVLVAVLYGSFFDGVPHARSDIDLAVYISAAGEEEALDITDQILMAAQRQVEILRLDDADESPFIVQQALKGRHLVDPDPDVLYAVWRRALHETEEIRFRRGLKDDEDRPAH